MINMIFRLFILLLFISNALAIQGQQVTVSEDINLRSDYLYNLIGKIDDQILLYRDKGMDHTLQVYDDNLWEKQSIELAFERKRIDLVGLVPSERDFNIFYSYRKKGNQILSCRKFDAAGQLVDTATLVTNNLLLSYQKYYYAYSMDKRYAAIFSFVRDNLVSVFMFDVENMVTVWEGSYSFDVPYIKRDFREMIVTDQGGCFMILEKSNFRIGKPNTNIEAYYLNQVNGGLTRQVISMEEKHLVDFVMDYDNVNNKLIMVGLYGDKFRYRADGYFYMDEGALVFNPFPEQLYRELEKNNKKKKISNLEDFVVADMVIRADGGALVFFELQKRFSRRSNAIEGRRAFDGSGYIDYYNEDVIALSIHPDGKEHWRTILRKKQFSQDDGAIYSSFFIFKTPTELRIIYNDEIRQDNTVSEYILNPIGENERNIVMNTEYQRLRLRFQNAVQISSKEFVVPSERNNRLNLVKVTF